MKILLKIKQNAGSVSILMALVIAMLLGFSALVVDVGFAFVEKSRLDTAIDAAALAGAQSLAMSSEAAINGAKAYLSSNKIDESAAIIEITDSGKGIRVTSAEVVEHFFAPIVGINDTTVTSTAKAIIGPAGTVRTGIRPVAVEAFSYSFGDLVTLKEGAGDGTSGNYGAVSFGPTGASVFQDFLINGYDSDLSVGDIIATEPGNMAGTILKLNEYLSSDYSTYLDYEADSIRLWTIPVVDSLDVSGRADVEIVAFAQFFVETAQKVGGEAVIKGRFIKFVTNGEIDFSLEDSGVYVSQLSR